MTPDFDRVRKTLFRQGEPDRVPIMEHAIDRDIKQAFLGRPVRTLEDEVEFWMLAGYDYVPLKTGIRTLLRSATYLSPQQLGAGASPFSKSGRLVSGHYSILADEDRERAWAEEGTGIIAGRAEFDAIKWPTADALDYSNLEEVQHYLPSGAKVIACMGNIFDACIQLMGFQNMFEKLVDDPDLVGRVMDTIGEIQLGVFDIVSRMDVVGATWHHDDIAYSTALMVAPKHLRNHLWPWYKRMCEISQQRGKPIIYHSDGKVDSVLDEIVGCGFTTLHPIEPKAMDIVQVKREYGDRLSLIGNIDLGYTLTRGTPEEVEEEVRLRISQLAPGGGYAVSSANTITEYVPLANFNALREAAFKYGQYPIKI